MSNTADSIISIDSLSTLASDSSAIVQTASNNTNEFFTAEGLTSFGTASLVVVVVSNVLRRFIHFKAPWIPFVVSMLVAIVHAKIIETLSSSVDYAIAFFNGCLLFCNATGVQEVATFAMTPKEPGGVKPHGKEKIKWFSSWFK